MAPCGAIDVATNRESEAPVSGKHKRRLSVRTAVLMGSGALALPLAFSQWVGAAPQAAPDPAVACQGIGSGTESVIQVPTATSDPVLCIMREGAAPAVRTALYVDGKLAAAIRTDACSWPNAAVSVSAGTVPLANGRAVVWGTLPSGARSAQIVSVSGRSIEVQTSGDPALPVFASVSSGDEKVRSIGAIGGPATADPTPVAACGAVQK